MDGNITSILAVMLYFKAFFAALLTGAIVWILPLAVLSDIERIVRRKSTMLIIFVLTLILISVPGTKRVFQERENADSFVAYCEEYKQEYGQYPEEMEDMVPEFFDRDQLVEFGYDESGLSNFLHYKRYNDGNCSLWYRSGVPFHTNHYRFDEKNWIHYGT